MCKFGRNPPVCLREKAILGPAHKCPYHVFQCSTRASVSGRMDVYYRTPKKSLNTGYAQNPEVDVRIRPNFVSARRK